MLLITYDLHDASEHDYEAVEDEILSFGDAVPIEESVWIVDTDKTPTYCRDELKAAFGDARYFVASIKRGWASLGLDPNYARWLEDAQRRW